MIGPGGKTIYFGPTSINSENNVESYFNEIPDVERRKENENIASWVLEQSSREIETDISDFYKNHDLYK